MEAGIAGNQAVVLTGGFGFNGPAGYGGGRQGRGRGDYFRGWGGGRRGWIWGIEMWSRMERRYQSSGDNVVTINHRDGA